MIRTTVEQTDPQGREVAVPAEVLAVLEPAHRYLAERLRAAEHLPIAIKWHRFDNSWPDGWTVEVHLEYDGWAADERLRVDHLREPLSMREAVREAVWKFARVLRAWVKDTLSRVREEMAQDRAQVTAGSEE